jgi:DNA (cytosine-5)-methyltransferase 1
VFVVASARDDINPTEILFEFEGVRRDTPQSRKEGKVTPTISSSGTGVSRVGFNCEDEWFIETPVCGALDTECGGKKMSHQTVDSGHIVAARMVAFGEYSIDDTASSMKARDYKDATDLVAQPIAFPSTLSGTQCASAENIAPSMGAKNPTAVAFNISPGKGELKDDIHVTDAHVSKTIDASASNPAMHQGGSAIVQAMAVRRLTPVECERLQGFPDGYTNIPWRKAAESPDGPRYKALGNSWAVPVVAWIGKRIQDQLK